jgi:hypothetical protein
VLVAVQLEEESNSAILAEIGSLRLPPLLAKPVVHVIFISKHTKFKTPAGVAFSSACLTK